MYDHISDILKSSIKTKQEILNDSSLLETIAQISDLCTTCFNNGGKVLFCGNGGSASDAQHLSAEFSGRFYKDRAPLFSEALHVNTSYLTAVANDYGFEHVYSRLIKAKGQKGDILFGLSTSGNSENIIKAFEQARTQDVICIGMTGASGGALMHTSDHMLRIPSNDTPRIQECHITIGHIICELVEKRIFS